MNKRSREYNEGWHEGRRVAESDLRNGAPTTRDQLFREHMRDDPPPSEYARAWGLGVMRGYRDTIARFDSGELTWEMFDTAPLGT